jgi:hypothetical protein
MSNRPDLEFQPVAGLLAVVLPGLGHAYLGHVKRGVLAFAGVMGLFLGGIFIGGIDAVDRREDFWWFVLQAGVGPVAFATDAVHQNYFKVEVRQGGQNIRRSGHPDPAMNGGKPAPSKKSLGLVNEAGSLYAAMAGMLNMIVIIDALWHAPARRRRDGEGSP